MISERVFDAALEAVARPVLVLTRVDERAFLGYLVSATLIAAFVWLAKLRGRLPLFRFLFPARVWLHRSALFDMRLMIARGLLSALIFSSLLISSIQLALHTKAALNGLFGASPLSLGPTLGLILISISAFAAEDFARYWAHRLVHRVPELWALHKVHHSAQVLTPFTIYRSHPLDSLLLRTCAALALGLSAGSCAWFVNARLSFVEIGGVHALSVFWNALGANLRHSHVWLSYPQWLQFLLISPAQHQIHHSIEERHHDKNFGSVLAIWDYAFGSLHQTEKREKFCFGLKDEELNHQDRVISSLLGPAIDALAMLSYRLSRDPRGRRARRKGAAQSRTKLF